MHIHKHACTINKSTYTKWHKKANIFPLNIIHTKSAEAGKSAPVNKHKSKLTKGFVVIKLQWSPYFNFHFEDEKIVLEQRHEKNSPNRTWKERLIIQRRVVTVGVKNTLNKCKDFLQNSAEGSPHSAANHRALHSERGEPCSHQPLTFDLRSEQQHLALTFHLAVFRIISLKEQPTAHMPIRQERGKR